MSVKVAIDCTTGEAVTEELTPAEEVDREDIRVRYRQDKQDHAQRDSRREQVLGKLAQAVGVPLDEVKDALGVGRRPAPDLKARTGR